MNDNLKTELETYERHREDLLADEGRHVVICGEDIIGTYDSYNDALKAGYEKCGLKPFLVKQIAAVDSSAFFTRNISLPCPI